jgi:hypothetical protein
MHKSYAFMFERSSTASDLGALSKNLMSLIVSECWFEIKIMDKDDPSI